MVRIRAFARRHASRVAVLLGCLALGVVAGIISLAVQPDVRGSLGPGEVTIDVGVRESRTSVDIPPLGRVLADSHRGPVGIDVRVDRIDLDRAGRLATEMSQGPGASRQLRADIDDDLAPLLRTLGLRSLGMAVAVGAVAGLVLPHRRARYVAATLVGSVGFVVVAGAMTFASFSPRAFDAPRFEGSLAAAPDIVNTVQRHIDDVSIVESRLQALSARLVGLYQSVETGGASFSDVTILHVSDLHSNPVGIELMKQTAAKFEVDAIIDTGDLTSFGAPVEELIVQQVARIRVPYYVVPGNHDHPRIRRALVEAGVQVLDPGVVRIAGIRVLGVGDPTFTGDNRLPRPAYDRAIERAAVDTLRRVQATDPHVVAVHNPLQLEQAIGRFDVGLAGHTHRFAISYDSGSVITEVGSAGATGVGAFADARDLPYQMQLLQFEGTRLVAIDRLSFEGTDGEFHLQRILIDPDQVDSYPDREVQEFERGPFAPLLRPNSPS